MPFAIVEVMPAPNFIIHASGSLGNQPDLGKKGYRLRCRFRIEARPTREHLKRGARKAMELFVRDMAKQGWQHWPQGGVRFQGPFVPVEPMTIHPVRSPSAAQMLPAVRQGAKFRAGAETLAQTVTPLGANEFWEYELALVFYRDTILVEMPNLHEEMRRLKTRCLRL